MIFEIDVLGLKVNHLNIVSYSKRDYLDVNKVGFWFLLPIPETNSITNSRVLTGSLPHW